MNVRVAVDICRAYTKKKLSSLKVRAMHMSKMMKKSDDANHKQNDKNEEKKARDKSDENNVSDSL